MKPNHRTVRRQTVQQVRDILAKQPVFLDTETSGISEVAEVIEIAVLDHQGEPLLNTLLKPLSPIPYEVQEIHGITNSSVQDAPQLPEVWTALNHILSTRCVVIYNAAFDLRLLAQSAKKYGLFPQQPPEVHCAMLLYANYHGAWNDEYEGYLWQRLGDAAKQCRVKLDNVQLHRAAGDCEATRRVMAYMAKERGRKKRIEVD